MAKNPLKITDTILRDAHQSQAATRMQIGGYDSRCCDMLDSSGLLVLGMLGRRHF